MNSVIFSPKALAFRVWLNHPPEARRGGYWNRPPQRGRVPIDNIIVIVIIVLFFFFRRILSTQTSSPKTFSACGGQKTEFSLHKLFVKKK